VAHFIPVADTGGPKWVKLPEGPNKAIAAFGGATLLPLILQTLFQAMSDQSGAIGVIWDWFMCAVLIDLSCPSTMAISGAIRGLLAAFLGGLLTGLWTYYTQNRLAPAARSFLETPPTGS
jgi:hypothetical protein